MSATILFLHNMPCIQNAFLFFQYCIHSSNVWNCSIDLIQKEFLYLNENLWLSPTYSTNKTRNQSWVQGWVFGPRVQTRKMFRVLWRPWCEVDYQVFTAEQDPEMFCEGSARPMKTTWRKSHFESDSEPSVSSSRIMRSQTHLQLAKYGSWKHIKLSGLWQTKVKDAQCHQVCVVFTVPGRILTQARLFPKLLSSLDSYL